MTPLATQTLALGPDWLDPTVIIDWLGPWALVGLAAIIFAECGLLLGFFLPGDSLLFTGGLFVAQGTIDVPLWLVCLVLVVSAFAGNVVGYAIGYKAGPAIFDKPKSKLFNPKYVTKTQEFFDKYGNRAIVLGRFVPVVRTFITVSAGVARMDPKRYLTYSLIGGVAWAAGVTVLGYFLGQFQFVRDNIDLILILVVLVSILPIIVEVLRARSKNKKAAAATPGAPAASTGGAPSDLTQPIRLPRDTGAPQGSGWDGHTGTAAGPGAGPNGHPTSGSADNTATTWITPVGPQDRPPNGVPGRGAEAAGGQGGQAGQTGYGGTAHRVPV
ncbi:DedA family protein, partial [Pseudonocardia sp. KRD-291]|nr:DedA family protein [Pseudonocardia sp. KRD291]